MRRGRGDARRGRGDARRFPLPIPRHSLPTGETLGTSNVLFVVNRFCTEEEKKIDNKIIFFKKKEPEPEHECAVSQPVALRTGR